MSSANNMFTDSGMTLTEKDFKRVSDVIYQHCGINLHDGKKSLVRARLAKKLHSSKCETFTEYIDFVLSDAGRQEFYSFVDSLSTNLTYFFRENVHYEYLRNTFLPQLIKQKSQHNQRKLRVWSAGCSSGEEPYSLAITLLETLQNTGTWDIKILATDVSTRILEIAKMGTYDKDRVEPLTAAQKQRFLIPNRIEGNTVYQVNPSIKKVISFRYLNLMDPWPFHGPFDVIFCRNVMIYFDKPTQSKLVNRYYDCLDSGGMLCIGHSESLTGIQHKYHYVQPATYAKP
ncbi:MAG: protein-glutamate O-methyltransferase [Planctomycetes bacterium]|nr:protein-glutamate O-methyltransferase [Planctomycetota bacterium]